MKTLGITGGIGPESTIESYRTNSALYHARKPDRSKAKFDIDGVILAATELPLILRDETHSGIPLLNTMKIHVEAAVAEMLS
jgi:aspartate/glutamate racemase